MEMLLWHRFTANWLALIGHFAFYFCWQQFLFECSVAT